MALRRPKQVGSPLSINALREDLQLRRKTVDGWLKVLERLSAILRLSPFGAPRMRAVKTEQKHYHATRVTANYRSRPFVTTRVT
jgi:predicted AAA+ superfamily ATPase